MSFHGTDATMIVPSDPSDTIKLVDLYAETSQVDQESKQAYNRVLHGLKQKVTAELRMVVKKAAAGSPLLGNPQIQDSYTSLTTSKVWRQSGCCAWGTGPPDPESCEARLPGDRQRATVHVRCRSSFSTHPVVVTVRPVLIGPGVSAKLF